MTRLIKNDHIAKCKLCYHVIRREDGRHVYDGICFPCLFDVLFFLQNYDPVEFESACDYARKRAKGERISA